MAKRKRSAGTKQERTQPTTPRTSSTTRPAVSSPPEAPSPDASEMPAGAPAATGPAEDPLKGDETELRKMIASKAQGEPLTDAEFDKLHGYLGRKAIRIDEQITHEDAASTGLSEQSQAHLGDEALIRDMEMAVPGAEAKAQAEELRRRFYADHPVALNGEPTGRNSSSVAELRRRGAEFVEHYLGEHFPAQLSAGSIENRMAAAILLRFTEHVRGQVEHIRLWFEWEYLHGDLPAEWHAFWLGLNLLVEAGALDAYGSDGSQLEGVPPDLPKSRMADLPVDAAGVRVMLPDTAAIPTIYTPHCSLAWGKRSVPLAEFLSSLPKGTKPDFDIDLHLTQTAVAGLLGIDPRQVRRYTTDGRLRQVETSDGPAYDLAEVLELRTRRTRLGGKKAPKPVYVDVDPEFKRKVDEALKSAGQFEFRRLDLEQRDEAKSMLWEAFAIRLSSGCTPLEKPKAWLYKVAPAIEARFLRNKARDRRSGREQ